MKSAPRPYRNQRLHKPSQKRQHQILEVSIRRDKERLRRIRGALTMAGLAILIIGVSAGLILGVRVGLRRFLWENPTFYLTDVRVSKDGTLTREQILTTGGVTLGVNIFTVDIKKVREALERLPQVDHAEVRRRLPHRIDIEVAERQPIAWVTEKADTDPTASDSALLIDARGYVMRSRKVPQDYSKLPIITGVVTENLAPGQKVYTLEMQAALDLIRLNADSTRWQVRSIDVTKGYCLVVTDRSHAQITFGLDDIDRQLSRLNRLLDYLETSTSERKDLQTVNLLVERNIPVTFVEPGKPEPPTPEPQPVPTPAAGKQGATEKTTTKKEREKSKPARSAPKTKENPGGSKLPPENVRKPFSLHG